MYGTVIDKAVLKRLYCAVLFLIFYNLPVALSCMIIKYVGFFWLQVHLPAYPMQDE